MALLRRTALSRQIPRVRAVRSAQAGRRRLGAVDSVSVGSQTTSVWRGGRRVGEELTTEDIEAAADLLQMVQAPTGTSLVVTVRQPSPSVNSRPGRRFSVCPVCVAGHIPASLQGGQH